MQTVVRFSTHATNTIIDKMEMTGNGMSIRYEHLTQMAAEVIIESVCISFRRICRMAYNAISG